MNTAPDFHSLAVIRAGIDTPLGILSLVKYAEGDILLVPSGDITEQAGTAGTTGETRRLAREKFSVLSYAAIMSHTGEIVAAADRAAAAADRVEQAIHRLKKRPPAQSPPDLPLRLTIGGYSASGRAAWFTLAVTSDGHTQNVKFWIPVKLLRPGDTMPSWYLKNELVKRTGSYSFPQTWQGDNYTVEVPRPDEPMTLHRLP